MAVLKHISSKNADYGAAEKYLTFEHNEFTMKPVLDEKGRLVPRENYRIATLNCGDEDFSVACMRANFRYGKNQKKSDVKSHHYIISFDPRDGSDNGLTADNAQSLGERFCREHFPGHQAIVCTHPDGHNGTGNIHVHIVINSLRIKDVPFLPYMDRPADTKAGCKHRCTNAAMEYLKAEVMEMCRREGLYQIDLLNGSKERITEREYWAQRKGQLALDKEISEGNTLKTTKFETDKAKLRKAIKNALMRSKDFDGFSANLLREGISVRESRGRFSYLTPDRTKPITARRLGDYFDKESVIQVLKETAEKSKGVQQMVDIGKKLAEGKGKGYEHWAKLHNLKNAAKTLSVYEKYGFSSYDDIDSAIKAAFKDMIDCRQKLKGVEKILLEKKELQKQILVYEKFKSILEEFKAQKTEKARNAYKNAHESDFIIGKVAIKYFKEHGIKKLPARKALQKEIEGLTAETNALYAVYREKKQVLQELYTIKRNMEQLLKREICKTKEKNMEFEL